ncbi:type II and III secretion system protein family protein [Delftia sp. UME58]|uniref:type II and III secretion system protein family protein n=1 Tax=Delftia sp. UME58 TaxID=1862322 RepID=UPI001600EB37|nr:pilus assembly protein N-terminal domain-containing protein [Delftia sp. UME58]MBB1648267.1 type II and III secretion system protein [Delftia sp. UME58]
MTSPSTSRHRHQHQVAPGATASHLQRAAWALCAGLAPLCLPAGTRAQQPVEAGPATAATAFAIPSRSAPEPSPPPGGQETLHGEALQLIAGRQHLLQAGVVPGRIAVGDPNVLDVKVLRSTSGGPSAAPELLLTPKAQGSTTLMVWPGKGGPPQTWQIQVRGQHLALERRLASVPEHAQVLAALRQNAPAQTLLLDRSQIDVKSNTVQVDVQVVEFKKTAMKRAGVNFYSGGPNNQGFNFGVFSPGVVGGVATTTGTGSGTGTGTGTNTVSAASPVASALSLVMNFGRAFSGAGITTQLSILEGNGLARVLAKPTLLAHTGQSASFLAGGELPIPVPSRDGNVAIQYKEFGIKLQLTPTILSDERIALKVSPEASDLDFGSGVTISGVSVPGVRTRRADTMVELADGESFIIGGLVSRNTTSNVSKVPLLGDLPVLGTFFKNLNYSQEETELVIIVTPRLVHPLPATADLDSLLPGARSEQRNASQVWGPFIAGGMSPNSALPGFSY